MLLSFWTRIGIENLRLILTSIVLTFAVGCSQSAPVKSVESSHSQRGKTDLKESSANFDSEEVGPFLARLKPLIELGFSDKEILQVQKTLESMKVDEEKDLEFPIRYQGEQTVLRIRIFMDDVNAPDLFFFTDPKLAEAIDAEIAKLD